MAENNDFLEDFYDTDELKNSISNSLSRYSQSTRICQYVPTDHKPSYSEMVDETKYRQLMEDIRLNEVDFAELLPGFMQDDETDNINGSHDEADKKIVKQISLDELKHYKYLDILLE